MQRFHNRVRQILMASGSTTFTKVGHVVGPGFPHVLCTSHIPFSSNPGLLSFPALSTVPGSMLYVSDQLTVIF